MRRNLIAVTVVLGALAGPASAAEPTQTPTLRVTDRAPLVIEGRGFAPSAQVMLVARIQGVVERKSLRSNQLGRFRVTLQWVTLTGIRRCAAGVVIAARTAGGGLTLWHPGALPNCPTPLRPPSVPKVPSV